MDTTLPVIINDLKNMKQYDAEDCPDAWKVYVFGVVVGVRFPVTKVKREKLAVVTLNSSEGKVEGIFFPKEYPKYDHSIKEGDLICLEGLTNAREKPLKIIVEEGYKVTKEDLYEIITSKQPIIYAKDRTE